VKQRKRKPATEPTRRSSHLVAIKEVRKAPTSPPANATLDEPPPHPPSTSQSSPSNSIPLLHPLPILASTLDQVYSHEIEIEETQEHNGRSSNCERDSSNEEEWDTHLEGGGLEDILGWPPEVLHQPPRRKHFKSRDERLGGIGEVRGEGHGDRGGREWGARGQEWVGRGREKTMRGRERAGGQERVGGQERLGGRKRVGSREKVGGVGIGLGLDGRRSGLGVSGLGVGGNRCQGLGSNLESRDQPGMGGTVDYGGEMGLDMGGWGYGDKWGQEEGWGHGERRVLACRL
jgi:hypothetical protein